jgi:hypothetical protein
MGVCFVCSHKVNCQLKGCTQGFVFRIRSLYGEARNQLQLLINFLQPPLRILWIESKRSLTPVNTQKQNRKPEPQQGKKDMDGRFKGFATPKGRGVNDMLHGKTDAPEN